MFLVTRLPGYTTISRSVSEHGQDGCEVGDQGQHGGEDGDQDQHGGEVGDQDQDEEDDHGCEGDLLDASIFDEDPRTNKQKYDVVSLEYRLSI